MAQDPEADVLRVVNRLHHNYDATATAGYRDVALNVRLETAEIASLGLNSHVCEVQLVLIDFAKIKVIVRVTSVPIEHVPCPNNAHIDKVLDTVLIFVCMLQSDRGHARYVLWRDQRGA